MEPSEQESIVEAIYPVGVAGGMRIIWFAWVSGDHDRVMSSNGRPVCDSSKEGLEGQVAARGRVLDWEGESVIDLDSLISSVDSGREVDPGEVVDAWNFMTDLSRVIDNAPNQLFHAELMETYDIFFSQCEVAQSIGLRSISIARRDLDRALVVLRDGRQMVQGIQLNIESPMPSPTVGRTHEIH